MADSKQLQPVQDTNWDLVNSFKLKLQTECEDALLL